MIGRVLAASLPARLAFFGSLLLASLFAATLAVSPARAQTPSMLEAYLETLDAYAYADKAWKKTYEEDFDDSYSYARLYAYYAWYEAYLGYVYNEPERFYNVFWLEYYAALEYYDEGFTGRRIDWPYKVTRLAFEETYLACTLAYSVILENFGR